MYPYVMVGGVRFGLHTLLDVAAVLLLFCGVVWRVRRRGGQWPLAVFIDAFFYVILGAVLGAAAGYAVPHLAAWAVGRPLAEGWWRGQHWMTAVAGAALVGVVYTRRNHLPMGRAFDMFAPVLPLAQALGRVGCLLNGDAFGRVTTAWPVMWLPDVFGNWAYRYPTQLADMLANLLIAAVLFAYERITPPPTPPINGESEGGGLFLLYVLLYCLQRFYFEFWRGDMPLLIGPFTWTHLYCAAGILFVLVLSLSRGGFGKLSHRAP
jgi:phosphatidylglycerol:prolipoprotein diacylglycerol transferase